MTLVAITIPAGRAGRPPMPAAELRRLYEVEGLTQVQIAAHFRRAHQVVARAMKRAGIPRRQPKPVEVRFWSKVERSGGCWLWTSKLQNKGYGVFSIGDAPHLAHRLSYELAFGPIPSGLHVLHRCDVPRCVRPDHLFLGTQADNIADMVAKGRQFRGPRARAAACKRGHPFDERNTMIRQSGKRECRRCHADRELAARRAGRRRR